MPTIYPCPEARPGHLRRAVARFMNSKESPNCKELVTKVTSIEAVERLLRIGAVETVDNDGNLGPLSLGVECLDDADAFPPSQPRHLVIAMIARLRGNAS